MENVLFSSICNVSKGNIMAKCPVCGKEVSTPKKTWKMAGKADKTGKKTELTIGLFEHCGKSFRSTLGKRKI
jgi:adenine-specific DNA methylase